MHEFKKYIALLKINRFPKKHLKEAKPEFWFDDFQEFYDDSASSFISMLLVALLFYVHGKHLRSCRDSQLT